MFKIVRLATLLVPVQLSLVACSESIEGPPYGTMQTYDAVWINAARAVYPSHLEFLTLQIDIPDGIHGFLCTDVSVSTRRFGGSPEITISNGCNVPLHMAWCTTADSTPIPEYTTKQCATVPQDTPQANLEFVEVPAATDGDPPYGPSRGELTFPGLMDVSLEIFYCSENASLLVEPMRCYGRVEES